MTWAITQATTADAHYIAPRMSPADAAEVWASGHRTPLEALLRSIDMSIEAWAWRFDGIPACLFGFSAPSLLGDWANPWMLGTPDVRRHRFTLLRHYRGYVARMLEQFPLLWTMVDDRHAACLRWLKWTGFEIGEPEPYGVEGLPFRPVKIARA